VLNFISPSVKRNCPVAVSFYVDVINSTNDFEETIFTPVAAPRVTNAPILDTIFNTPTDDTDFVIFFKSASCVIINTISVLNKRFRVSNCA
jgi:hypothetical protein